MSEEAKALKADAEAARLAHIDALMRERKYVEQTATAKKSRLGDIDEQLRLYGYKPQPPPPRKAVASEKGVQKR